MIYRIARIHALENAIKYGKADYNTVLSKTIGTLKELELW